MSQTVRSQAHSGCGILVKTLERSYFFCAESVSDAIKWRQALTAHRDWALSSGRRPTIGDALSMEHAVAAAEEADEAAGGEAEVVVEPVVKRDRSVSQRDQALRRLSTKLDPSEVDHLRSKGLDLPEPEKEEVLVMRGERRGGRSLAATKEALQAMRAMTQGERAVPRQTRASVTALEKSKRATVARSHFESAASFDEEEQLEPKKEEEQLEPKKEDPAKEEPIPQPTDPSTPQPPPPPTPQRSTSFSGLSPVHLKKKRPLKEPHTISIAHESARTEAETESQLALRFLQAASLSWDPLISTFGEMGGSIDITSPDMLRITKLKLTSVKYSQSAEPVGVLLFGTIVCELLGNGIWVLCPPPPMPPDPVDESDVTKVSVSDDIELWYRPGDSSWHRPYEHEPVPEEDPKVNPIADIINKLASPTKPQQPPPTKPLAFTPSGPCSARITDAIPAGPHQQLLYSSRMAVENVIQVITTNTLRAEMDLEPASLSDAVQTDIMKVLATFFTQGFSGDVPLFGPPETLWDALEAAATMSPDHIIPSLVSAARLRGQSPSAKFRVLIVIALRWRVLHFLVWNAPSSPAIRRFYLPGSPMRDMSTAKYMCAAMAPLAQYSFDLPVPDVLKVVEEEPKGFNKLLRNIGMSL